MATSGSTNYEADRNAVIKGALRIVGAIAQGQTPSTDQYTEAAEALNMLVKALQTYGMPLWAIKINNFALTNATATYRIGLSQTINTPKPLKILQAFLRNTTSNVDTPLQIITKHEYWELGNKTTTGLPIQLMYDPQNLYGDLYLYPTPDSTAETSYEVYIIYHRPFEDFDSATDTPDFPQEWHLALKFGLAEQLAPEYGVSLEQYGEIAKKAKEYRIEALSFGTEEGSLFFTIDRR